MSEHLMRDTPRVVVLVPAHNEEKSIAATLRSLREQYRPADLIVVLANGCTDRTVGAASEAAVFDRNVIVEDLPRLPHGKASAMNQGWNEYAQDADIFVGIDADTLLPPGAIADWIGEFEADQRLAGSSSKFTMLGGEWLTRLQRAEFARWTDTSLRRGWTSVLAGTACAIRGSVLVDLAGLPDREGPWACDSEVEDFELTYRIRQLGYRCQVSPTVRAYTDSMKTIRSLWSQRLKWSVGTVDDLLRFGVNRLTLLDWTQQALGLMAALVRVGFVVTVGLALILGMFVVQPLWLLVPLLFIANDVKQSLRIPHRDKRDVILAALLLPQEMFAWMRAGWFVAAWVEVLASRVTGRRRDRWSLQYEAEGR